MIKRFLIFWSFLPKGQTHYVATILLLMLLLAATEGISIGLIIPIANVYLNPEIIETNEIIKRVFTFFGEPTLNNFTLILISLFVLFYVLKNILSVGLTYIQTSYAMRNASTLAQALLASYMHAPYETHMGTDSSSVIAIIHEFVGRVFNDYLLPVMALVTEVLASIAIVGMLFLVEPRITSAVALAFLIGGALFYLSLKDRFHSFGKEIVLSTKGLLRILRETVSSLKEAKIAGVESHFIGTYGKLRDYVVNLIVTVATLNVLPRAATEVMAILVLAVIASSILISGRNEAELLPVFGLFALAALRLLPSANRILYSMVKIRTSSPTVDEIIRECDRIGLVPSAAILPARSDVHISAEITMKGVSYKYPNTDKLAISDVSFMARPGEIVGIAGRSGAGKSTITNVILGLIKPHSGTIKYGDLSIDDAAAPLAGKIGYVPQSIRIINRTLRENVAFGISAEEIDDGAVWRAIEGAQLQKVVDDLPDGLETMLGEDGMRLSGGQRQRVAIARALYTDPVALVFDEATSALDNETEKAISESIRKVARAKTVVVVAHRVSTLEKCDRLYFVDRGRIRNSGTFEMLRETDPEFCRLIAERDETMDRQFPQA